jgi:hypothetical protein
MTQNDFASLGGDCQVSNVHSCLTATNNHDVLANTKFLSLLELRRVHDFGNIVNAFNGGNIWSDVQTRANSNSLTMLFQCLAILGVLDNVSTINVRTDFSNHTGKVHVILQLEVLNVSSEICAVLGCREEVWRLRGLAVTREGSKLSGGHKLW